MAQKKKKNVNHVNEACKSIVLPLSYIKDDWDYWWVVMADLGSTLGWLFWVAMLKGLLLG